MARLGKTEKGEKRVLLFAIQAIFSLFLLHLLYTELFTFKTTTSHDIWMQSLSRPKGASHRSTQNDDRQSPQYLITRLVKDEDRSQLDATGFTCDNTSKSIVCVANKPVRIDTNTMQVHLPPHHLNFTPAEEHIPTDTIVRPYAGQEDKKEIRKVLMTTTTSPPACDHNHQHPAILFSTIFIGNPFHELDELIIPLFITSRLFQSRVHFIILDYNPFFVQKYNRILSSLSNHEIINPVVNSSVHCFPGFVVGLKFHKFLGITSSDDPQGYYAMSDFKQFLRTTYKLKKQSILETKNPPILLLISRRTSRKFLNEAEMVKMMEELGFQVIIASSVKKMSDLKKFSKVVNSCSVMVGAHGAGLTNEVFLPKGAVLIQIRPLGLEWVSSNYFGEPAHDMGVRYLEYEIEPEESTLVDLYGRDHPAVANPSLWQSNVSYQVGRAMYLEGQDMRINVNRFRVTIVDALGFIASQKVQVS